MDLKRVSGSTALSMRLAIRAGTGSSGPGYVSTVPFVLSDSNWHHATFNLNAASLTAVNSPGSLASVLTAPVELRLLHASAITAIGESVSASVGADNIKAVVPEPTSGLAMTVLAACGVAGRRQRRSRAR
jgi:hypothetical protein